MWWLRSFLALNICFCVSAEAAIPRPSFTSLENRDVRVLLGHFNELEISGTDLVLNNTMSIESSSVFSIHCNQAGISYGLNSKPEQRLQISSRGNFVNIQDKAYRGDIFIYIDHGNCAVVNKLNLEKYIAGLINKEMLASWPMEALRAQAVASRTYALHQMQYSSARNFDLESTTQDQVYDGASSETPKSNRAAESTQGMVLAWKHEPIKAFFHADCGGKTENPEAVWGEKYGYIRPVVCPYHRTSASQKHWIFHSSLYQLDHALHKVAGLLPRGFARLAHLESGPNNENARMNDLIISDSQGNTAVISANAFRNAVGNTHIKSTAFDLHANDNGVEFDGHGYGHGVGMCQIGAKAMADLGKSYREILHFYYPLAKLERLQ